ncbi:MAG: glycerophosphodiester phosphodiesterase [Tetrasphaera sp.]
MRASDFPFFDLTGPVGLAHRGGAYFRPNMGRENTIAAFRKAVDMGYRYIETDVRATSDGELVTFHDDRLERVTDGRGLLREHTYEQIQRARTVADDTIPLLDDVLEEFPDTRFNIDCKSDLAIEPLVTVIRRHRAIPRVCIAAFSGKRLAAIRKELGPTLATATGAPGVAGLRLAPLTLSRLLRSAAPVLQIPVQHDVRGATITLVTPRLVRRAHALGKQVFAWTIDDPAEMGRLLDIGVDGIISDRIDVLRDVFAARNLPV